MFANSGDQLLSINDQFSLAMDLGFQIKENRKNLLNLRIETSDIYKETIQKTSHDNFSKLVHDDIGLKRHSN